MQPEPLHGQKGRLLAVDDEKGSFGDLALHLVRLGVDVLFATAVDEAELLARQEGEQLRGAFAPAGASEDWLAGLIDAIGPHTAILPESIAVLGPRQEEDRCEQLRELGFRYRLWEPYEDRDLRFLGWALIWNTSDQNLRIDARVPTALPGKCFRRGDSREVLIGDLSVSGAYLEMQQPFPAGSMVRVELALPAGPVELRATVRWVSSPRGGSPIHRRGCGVEFLRPNPGARQRLEETLDEELARFFL